MSDAALVLRARGGDELAFRRLLDRHRDLLNFHVGRRFAPGCDRADLWQEAMFGLHKAVRDYRSDRHSGFRSFASLCIERQVLTAVKTATRGKHKPLNESASLDSPVRARDDESASLHDLLASTGADPVEALARSEELATFGTALKGLTEIERQAAKHIGDGLSYEETARLLGVGEKTIDNALSRARRKLGAALDPAGLNKKAEQPAAVRVRDFLGTHPQATVAEIATRLRLAKPTVYCALTVTLKGQVLRAPGSKPNRWQLAPHMEPVAA